MTPRHARALRGTAGAWVATIVAAAAHTLGGGGAPPVALVAAVGVLAAPFAVAIAGRRLAAWRIAATVLAAQALFHLAFAVTAGTDPSALHGHHVAHLGDDISGVVLPDAAMLAAHGVAAALTIVALHGGERMLRALGRGIRSALSRVRTLPPRPRGPRHIGAAVRRPRPAAALVLSDASRRGPPALAAAAS